MVREELNEQIRYLVPANMFKTNLNRSVMMVATLLAYKYLQRLDVCYLIIRKWTVQKQQAQLNAYFFS
jgi:hypothetical protein